MVLTLQRWILFAVATAWWPQVLSPMDQKLCDLNVYIQPLLFDLILFIFALFI
jgi:hypothetical protein